MSKMSHKKWLLKPTGMSGNDRFFTLPAEFIRVHAREFEPWVCLVYIALVSHADKNRECFPSVGHLSDETGVPYKKVADALGLLEAYNLIATTDKARNVKTTYLITEKSHWRKDMIPLDMSHVKSLTLQGKAAVWPKTIPEWGSKVLDSTSLKVQEWEKAHAVL